MTSTLLSLGRYFEALTSDAEKLACALESGAFDAAVDACPEWTLADLGYHVGDVVLFWNWVVMTGATTTDGEPEFARPADRELADWLRGGVHELIGTLRHADPSAAAYSWTPQRDVAFIQRRVPHEVAVHRWDAQHAARQKTDVDAEPIASDLATDGVSEFFLLASSWPTSDAFASGSRVLLTATDSHVTWTSWVADGRMQWSTGASGSTGADGADAAVTLSAPASDLLLTLWRRMPLGDSRLEVHGDAAVAADFLSLATLD